MINGRDGKKEEYDVIEFLDLDTNVIKNIDFFEISPKKIFQKRIIFHQGIFYSIGGINFERTPKLINKSFKVDYSDEIIKSDENRELDQILKLEKTCHHFKKNEGVLFSFKSIGTDFLLTDIIIKGDESSDRSITSGIMFCSKKKDQYVRPIKIS